MESLRLFAVCLVLAVATGIKVDRYFDCGTPGYSGTIKELVLEGVTTCDPECLLYYNHNHTGHITFIAHANSQTATNEAIGDYAGDVKPFAMEPTACGNGLHCPIVKGSEVTYTATVTTPGVGQTAARVTARWHLVGDDGRDLVCFVIPVRIIYLPH